MDRSSPSFRNAPPGWEAAVVRLAEQRAEELLALKQQLQQRIGG
jgi:hypothetical protein